jgi:endonuclease/exonuclease/phosphatase family metal-dependent hydrolase
MLFLSLLLFSFTAVDAVGEDTVIVMSYNVRNARGLDEVTDYRRLADVILREAPDVVAVQELDSATRRNNGADVLREIAERVRMYSVYGASIVYDGGKYGLGVLSKERPLHHYSVALPGREEERQLLVVEFGRYVVGCTHLSLTDEDRMSSVDIIRREAARARKPFFLAGDLNDTPGTDVIKELQKSFLLLNDVENFTFPADKPERCIDYIAYYEGGDKKIDGGKAGMGKPFSVISSRVAEDCIASDHRPVAVKIRFNAEQSDMFRSPSYWQNPDSAVDRFDTMMLCGKGRTMMLAVLTAGGKILLKKRL